MKFFITTNLDDIKCWTWGRGQTNNPNMLKEKHSYSSSWWGYLCISDFSITIKGYNIIASTRIWIFFISNMNNNRKWINKLTELQFFGYCNRLISYLVHVSMKRRSRLHGMGIWLLISINIRTISHFFLVAFLCLDIRLNITVKEYDLSWY